ncbi:MAG: hypothetical protein NTV34_08845, partial [Proteobacteria bacterium]|nr:hypothetical protein [Pseudomonadota bacterium]
MSRQTEKLYLEFGSGQFRACVSWKGSDGGACVSLFSVPSSGLRRGDVAEMGAASDALERLLTQLDSQGFSGFQSCELVLPGSLTQSFIVNARLQLGGVSITLKHGQALRDDLMACVSDPSLEVIDVSVQSWICEGFQGTELPEGRNSTWLEAVAFSTVIDRHTLARAVSVCNGSGLTVSATHSSLAAAAQLMLRLSPDASNRIVIDLGHSFTCGMVLVGQKPNAAFMIKAGAHHVTRDIAAALGCSLNTAELLK